MPILEAEVCFLFFFSLSALTSLAFGVRLEVNQS